MSEDAFLSDRPCFPDDTTCTVSMMWSSTLDNCNCGETNDVSIIECTDTRVKWDELTDIFICELVAQAYSLGLMLDGLSVDDCGFELIENAAMDSITLRVLWSVLTVMKQERK